MNINTLKEIIDVFNLEIIDSGFKRDTQDYITSLPNNQQNIVTLREIATKTSEKLNNIYTGDLPDLLPKLFVSKIQPLTETPFNIQVTELLENNEIQLQAFFQQLNQILSQLNNLITQNVKEITRLSTFIDPYIDETKKSQTDSQKAIISVLFRDIETTTKLNHFSKTIQSWNRILPVYHQIIKSTSPEDIEIITVQNGSIDFLINIDIDVAIDFAKIFKVGFGCFMGYLSYKKMAKPIVATYNGNKKLLELEEEREKEMINNIGEAVKKEIIEQHTKASKEDKGIEKNADKKIEQVVKLVTNHILKGNDLKLVALPEAVDDGETEDEDSMDMKEELRTISSQVRQAIKSIPKEEIRSLLESYPEPEE